LVNFWATWCPPCVEELPLLDSFHQQQKDKGWQMLGIAVDQPSAVRQWLQRSPLSFPVLLAGLQGTEMSKSLGNRMGGLPFSLLFSAKGDVLERKLGQMHATDLQAWAQRS
jgi:thiol-disulfide isomerase/thioredoxin